MLNIMRYKVAILYHQISQNSNYYSHAHAITDNQTSAIVRYIYRLLKKNNYRTQIIGIKPNQLNNLKKINAGFVFNLVDSKAMEIRIAKILSKLKIPYSGSPFEALKFCNNKIRTKKFFEKHNLPTPKYSIIRQKGRITKKMVPSHYPVIIKPSFEHCSIGINQHSIATGFKQFEKIIKTGRKKYKQILLAEEFIFGEELQVTVIETDKSTIALPIAQLKFKNRKKTKWNIYGYSEKWNVNCEANKNCYFRSPPTHIPQTIQKEIMRESIRAFHLLGLRDYARLDLRYNPKIKKWFFLEVNVNSGLDFDLSDSTNTSIRAYGLTFDEFILGIVNPLRYKQKD